MTSKMLILALFLSATLSGISQKNLNLGVAYLGDQVSHPGLLLEFEIEKYGSENFSLPFRIDLGFFSAPDYNALQFDLHKGVRKYFNSDLFLEQSIGIGILSTNYTLDNTLFSDKHGNTIRYQDGANIGLMPSVTFGIGCRLLSKNGAQHLLWIRPKVYWNLGFRGLNLPYGATQIGFSYNFKTKNG